MTITPSLCNLPNELAISIFNRVPLKSILNLRKVCRDLRIRIDDIKPEANVLNVSIDVTDSEIRFMYSEIQTDVEDTEILRSTEVEYEKTVESGRCIVRCDGSEKIVNDDFMKLALRDFLSICKFQKKCLQSIIFANGTEYSNHFLQLLENLKSFMAVENRLLKVHNVRIYTNDQKSTITALSLIEPQPIYSIAIHNPFESNQPMDIAEIMEMEHWKTAKRFVFTFLITGFSAHNFRHFSVFDVRFQSISVEHLLDWKKIFQNSTEANFFIIRYMTFVEIEQFLEKMGPFNHEINWFFRMTTTDDDVLCIHLEERLKFVTFHRCNVHEVPKNARIQN